MKMRKIVAVVMTVLMLCCVIPFAATADGSSATIDFGDKANRVSYSTEQQVWAQNGITVTNDKAASTSNVGDYGGDGYPVRFYKGSSVTVEYTGMTKIEFHCDDYKASYVTDLQSSITDGSVSVNGTVLTVAFAAPVNSLVIAELVAQVRVDSITVYTGEGGDAPIVPDEPEVPSGDPEADTELSIADAIALGLSKEHNVYTEGKYFVTGVIKELYNDVYGNMRLTDAEGNILTIYGTYSADGELRYDAMEVKPVAGDTVTIYGAIGSYNGTAQIKNGWIVEHTIGETPDQPEAPAVSVIDAPVAGTAYKFGMIQGNVSATDVYYLIGGMNGFYMATGTDAAAAIDVYLETAEGGYYCYAMVNGVKNYINMVVSADGLHVNGAYEAAASTVYTFDADAKTIVAEVDGAPYWFGTRNDKTYTTVGPCKTEFAGFYCQFYGVAGGETPDQPDEPETPDQPDQPVTPDEPAQPVAPSVDTAFKFGMAQGNLDNQLYYLAGGMDGYYMATTTDITAAIDVYLEATEGGFYFYTIENGAKKYINMVVSADGLHVNGAYEDAASTVYTYDADAQTLVADVDGASYWFATRNDKQYTTMGPCKVEYEGFYGKFFTAGGKPVQPDSPDTGDNGVVYVTLAVVLMALAVAAAVVTSKKRA